VQGVVDGVDVIVVGNIITVIPLWRGVEGEQPDRCDSELLQVVKLAAQALKIADSVCP